MEEELLREIAAEFLVPLFSGAELADRAEESSSRDALVAYRDPNTIAFKVHRDDEYRHRLKRSQAFAKSSEVVVPEIDVIHAFVDVVSQMSEVLESDLKNDVLSTFQRRVVARAVAGKKSERTVLSGIDRLADWGSRLYEGAPIAAAIGFRNRPHPARSVRLSDFAGNDFGAVLGNGYDTLLEFSFRGRFVSHRQLSPNSGWPSFCPLRQAAIADWTTVSQRRVALTLNRLGEILVLRDQQLLFARRSGKWHFLTHDPVVSQMALPQRSREIRTSIYETCLDASFARTGACIGVISGEHAGDWRNLVDRADQLDQQASIKAQAISKMISGKAFHQLDRRLRQELAAIDGATVISHTGAVLAVGAILRIPGGSVGGGRLAAAKALSHRGLGIKVSQDGGIVGFRGGNADPVFRVM